MSLRSLLLKRNIIAVLVVGSVLLGTGFGFVVPSVSDLGEPAESGSVGPSGGTESADGPPDNATETPAETPANDPTDTDDETDEPPAQTPFPTANEMTRDAPTPVDDTDGDDDSGGNDDGDNETTPELVVDGETNATVA